MIKFLPRKMKGDLMFALVRNDDGYPVIIEIFFNIDDVRKARKWHGRGYFIEEITV